MKRREFIAVLGAAAAWPGSARTQQSAIPVIGYLGLDSVDDYRARVSAFRQGLYQSGYVEGRNVAIDFRWSAIRASSSLTSSGSALDFLVSSLASLAFSPAMASSVEW